MVQNQVAKITQNHGSKSSRIMVQNQVADRPDEAWKLTGNTAGAAAQVVHRLRPQHRFLGASRTVKLAKIFG